MQFTEPCSTVELTAENLTSKALAAEIRDQKRYLKYCWSQIQANLNHKVKNEASIDKTLRGLSWSLWEFQSTVLSLQHLLDGWRLVLEMDLDRTNSKEEH